MTTIETHLPWIHTYRNDILLLGETQEQNGAIYRLKKSTTYLYKKTHI